MVKDANGEFTDSEKMEILSARNLAEARAFSDAQIAQLEVSTYELVNRPKHYDDIHGWGFTCIDLNELMPGNVSAATKHLWRCGHKPGMELKVDVKKALWYLNREIEAWKFNPDSSELVFPIWLKRINLNCYLPDWNNINKDNPIRFLCNYIDSFCYEPFWHLVKAERMTKAMLENING